ncbi:MAG: carboxypeptidase regulatory-like domain-containing protein [Bryobacteraceae bacterium]
MRFTKTVAVLICTAAALVFCGAVRAQESRASLLGRVIDPSGALVVGAAVRATNVETNTTASSVTNEQGNYEIPYLLPGIYRVEVELSGFKKAVREGIELHVADRQAMDFTLEIGAVTETIAVGAQADLLETTNASVGTIMQSRQASELPIVGGNAFYLARLTPGVLSSGGRSAGNPMDTGAGTDIIVNGVKSGSSEITLDGVPNMTERDGAIPPIQDLVQEFRIQTATFDASLGHAAGAVTNVSLKSGTNTLHATSYGFYSRWRAVPWFTNKFIYDPTTGPINEEKKARALEGWRHERWGATAGGPVILPKLYNGRSRTFWVFGYEGLYIMRNLNGTYNVPPDAQRTGDFSALLKVNSRYQIYDPMTIVPSSTSPGHYSRSPLPGNIIPASRLDPAALKILEYWPKANQAGNADFRQNYFRTRDINRDDRNLSGKLDHNFSEQHRMFFRLSNNQHDNKNDTLPGLASGTILDRTTYGAVLDDVYVFNPQTLLNVRYGLTYEDDATSRRSQRMDLTTLGFPQSLVEEIKTKGTPGGIAFPQISVDGLQKLGDAGGNRIGTIYHTWAGTLTRMTGSHSFRMGGEYRVQRENAFNYGAVAPNLTFSTTWTRGPLENSPTAPNGVGQGLATFLFGLPTSGSIAINGSRAEQSTFTGLFLQDDWRVTPRFSLNLGLRWEYEGADTERFNRSVRGFDFTSPNPISAAALAAYAKAPDPILPVSAFRTIGGYTFPGVGGQPRALWQADRNNFAPRIGFAYSFGRNVIRGGYGIFYDVIGVDRSDITQSGFSQPTTFVASSDNGQTYRATLRNPFPDGLQKPAGASAGLATFLGRDITYYPEKAVNPYMQRWTFSVQRELPSRILTEVAYVGNRGTKLPVSREWNFVPARYLSTSPVRDEATYQYNTAQVSNPFYGLAGFEGTGRGTNKNFNRTQLVIPFPHFTGVNASLPIGYSWYHSMQTRLEKRISHGVTFQVGWTWSKLMEALSFRNTSDEFLEEVISDQDFTHRITVSGIFELPVGRGKPLLGQARGVLNHIVGGWSVQGWFEGQTGDALGFGNNTILYGSLKDIVLPKSQRRVERWFNIDAGFERDTAKQLVQNIATFPSRFSGIRADGINNFDLSMFKNFMIREPLRVQFRFETFNTLNHVQFASPDTTPTSTAFGTITGEKGHGQRQITLAVKVMF